MTQLMLETRVSNYHLQLTPAYRRKVNALTLASGHQTVSQYFRELINREYISHIKAKLAEGSRKDET